jgi:hypothetical protein
MAKLVTYVKGDPKTNTLGDCKRGASGWHWVVTGGWWREERAGAGDSTVRAGTVPTLPLSPNPTPVPSLFPPNQAPSATACC